MRVEISEHIVVDGEVCHGKMSSRAQGYSLAM